MEYIALRVRVNFYHSLLRCDWLWVRDNLCLLWDYLCLLHPWATSCLCHEAAVSTSIFYSCQKCHLEDITKIVKNSMLVLNLNGVVGKTLIKLETSFTWDFLQLPFWYLLGSKLCKHARGRSVTTKARISLAAVCVVWRSGSSMGLFYLRYCVWIRHVFLPWSCHET